jgi:hypothetical protein
VFRFSARLSWFSFHQRVKTDSRAHSMGIVGYFEEVKQLRCETGTEVKNE